MSKRFGSARSASERVFRPLDLPNISLWLRGDAGLTYDGSNLISTWADQSASANNFTQAGSSRPFRVAAGLRGLDTIRCDGAATFLTGPNASIVMGTGQHSTWIVFKAITSDRASGIQVYNKNAIYGVATGNLGLMVDTTPQVSSFHFNTSAKTVTAPLTLGTWYRARAKWDAVNRIFGLGAAADGSIATTTHDAFTSPLTLGRAVNFGNVEIAEMVVIQRSSSAAEDAIVGSYLQRRWGVA